MSPFMNRSQNTKHFDSVLRNVRDMANWNFVTSALWPHFLGRDHGHHFVLPLWAYPHTKINVPAPRYTRVHNPITPGAIYSSHCEKNMADKQRTFELTYWCRSIRSSPFCCLKESVSSINFALEVKISLKHAHTIAQYTQHRIYTKSHDARVSLGFSDRRLCRDRCPSIYLFRDVQQRRQSLPCPLLNVVFPWFTQSSLATTNFYCST